MGGTLRDLLLDRGPVFWVHQPVYLWLTSAAAILTFFVAPHIARRAVLLLWADAVGMACWAVDLVAADLLRERRGGPRAASERMRLRYGAMRGEGIKRALRSAAKAAAEDPELLKWLVTKGLDAEQPAERDAAMLLLTQAPPAVLKPLVDRLRADLRAE